MSQKAKINIQTNLVVWPAFVSLLATVLVTFFVVSLIRFDPDQVKHMLLFVAGVFPLLFISSRAIVRSREQRIMRYWNAVQEGKPPADETEARRVYTQVMNHPRFLLIVGVGFWGAGTLLVGAFMFAFEGISGFDFLKICFSGFSQGIIASIFMFYISKQFLNPVRASFQRYRSIRGFGEGVIRIGLRAKLITTFVSIVFVTLAFSALMFYEQTQRAVEQAKMESSRAVFESLRSELSRLPVDKASNLNLGALADQAGMEPGSAVALLDQAGKRLAFAGDAHGIAALRTRDGSGDAPNGQVIFGKGVPGKPWRLALYTPTGLASHAATVLHRTLALQFFTSLSIAVGLALLAANEVNRALQRMAEWSKRIASGDLTTPLRIESEDELGSLAASLSDMSFRLREMILHVKDNTSGVEEMSAEVATMSQAVMESSDEQSSSVLDATSVFEQMNASIKGIAEHTEHLSVSAEESSSSILEMGATVEEVSGNVESLGRSVDESVSSIEQMTSSIHEVARNVEGLSEVAEETNCSMEEMAASIRQVEENANETHNLSVDMVRAAETGSERVLATILGIESIRTGSEEAQQVITKLGARAEEIGEILNVIDEVAEETNLLALNAAIIAAQAGEHGRGFSVVADEIKDLADRVGTSTKEIGKLIKAVQDESGNAIMVVKRGAEQVVEGERLSREAGRALDEITASARRSGEMIGEIAQASAEQTKGSRSVVNAMERVREMVAQIKGAMVEQSRGSERVMTASMSMRDVAQQVRGTILEQARGSGRITTSIENIRDMVQQINGAIQEQLRGTEQAVVALEHIRERAEQNQDAALKMGGVVKGMVSEADVLKQEVGRFQLGESTDAPDGSAGNQEPG
ncbi:MAG: methyl-accepting chemotaxis protein [Deltaproteobacteria bacterium]|nr:methyl-accepting chemotaxis protein [Deltaproteobacteria bacterium]